MLSPSEIYHIRRKIQNMQGSSLLEYGGDKFPSHANYDNRVISTRAERINLPILNAVEDIANDVFDDIILKNSDIDPKYKKKKHPLKRSTRIKMSDKKIQKHNNEKSKHNQTRKKIANELKQAHFKGVPVSKIKSLKKQKIIKKVAIKKDIDINKNASIWRKKWLKNIGNRIDPKFYRSTAMKGSWMIKGTLKRKPMSVAATISALNLDPSGIVPDEVQEKKKADIKYDSNGDIIFEIELKKK